MRRCPVCNADYPASYKYCPEDGTPVQPRSQPPEQHCPSCRARLTEDQQAFCTACGIDVGSISRASDSAGPDPSAAPEPAPQPELEAKILRGDVPPSFKSALQDRLVQALSSVEPRNRPWVGVEFDADLLAVSPQAVIVAGIIEPAGIDQAVVHSSLDPLESWLLTTPDGAGQPVRNPVPKVLQTIRGVRLKLAPYLERKSDTPHVRIKGLVVFPDEYDVSRVKKQVNYDTASTVMRIINARELPEEVLNPVQHRRLNVERCREWLNTTIVKEDGTSSIAGTWLDAHAAESFARPRAAAAKASAQQRQVIPETIGSSAGPPVPAARRRAGRVVARIAGLSLALAVPLLVGLWQLDRLRLLMTFAQSTARREAPVRSVPSESSQSAQSAQSREPPQHEGSNGSSRPAPAIGEQAPPAPEERVIDSRSVEQEETENKGEGQARFSPEVRRKTIENRIDTAIRNRAVTGVKVSFVDETAYLAGEVISHNQKAAAERAARAIPEVKQVRSSIAVMWNRG